MDIKLVNNVEQYLSLHKVLDQDYTCTLLFTHVNLSSMQFYLCGSFREYRQHIKFLK